MFHQAFFILRSPLKGESWEAREQGWGECLTGKTEKIPTKLCVLFSLSRKSQKRLFHVSLQPFLQRFAGVSVSRGKEEMKFIISRRAWNLSLLCSATRTTQAGEIHSRWLDFQFIFSAFVPAIWTFSTSLVSQYHTTVLTCSTFALSHHRHSASKR